jgi:hypothetical protein
VPPGNRFRHYELAAIETLGEYADEYDPYVCVASIEKMGDDFRVAFLHQDAEEPTTAADYTSEKEICVALDDAV